MGEMAEYYLEQMVNQEIEDWLWDNPRPRRNGYWTTLKGERLKISDMETGHIKNCIRHCLRRGSIVPPEFHTTLTSRGEIYDLK